ncbi:MAG: hypothetical protein ABI885_13045 [Gammaproteobacteria bacterium]
MSRANRCSEQITLSLAPGVDRTDRVVKDVSRNADVQLEYLRSASPTLHVFTLTTPANDPGCNDALTRLRQNRHVRFAEIDRRRSYLDSVR